MSETREDPTKTMFDCLAKLYKQGQLLLMGALITWWFSMEQGLPLWMASLLALILSALLGLLMKVNTSAAEVAFISPISSIPANSARSAALKFRRG